MIHLTYNFEDLPTIIKNQWKNIEISRDIQHMWLKTCEKAIKNYTPIYYVKESEGNIDFIAVGNLIRKLDCLHFIQNDDVVQKILEKRKLDNDYYKYDVLFIGGPMSMEAGTYFSENVDYNDVFQEFQKNIFDSKIAEGIFFTNVDIHDRHLSGNNTISFPYYPNTMLKLPFESFDDYLNNQKAKRRWDIKNKQKLFNEQGCSIEIIQNSKINEVNFSILYELYANTENNNFETINYQHYCDCDKFQSFKYLTDDFIWIIAKQNGRIIGFALLVHDESKLTLKHVGLDYSVNRQTYLYFNLFYRAIKFGIDNHYRYIICGSTTYDVKVSLGCELINRTAYISIDKNKGEDVSDLYNLTLGGNL